jgi:hypothetical protein
MGTRGRGTQRSWVQAYWRYAATSAEAGGVPGRWAFFSCLLGYRFGRESASGFTGVSGGLPAITASTFSTARSTMA